MAHWNRRQFIVSAASVAGAASFAHATRISFAQAAKGYGFKLGLQMYSLRGYNTVEAALPHAKNLGFEEVEFYSGMFPVEANAERIAAIKKMVSDAGMTISAHGVNTFTNDEAACRKVFDFAKAVGIRNITADIREPAVIDILSKLVKEYNIRIALHNHGPTHRFNKVVDVLRVIEGKDERVGACADLGHYIRSGEKPVDVIRALKGRLYGIHLKDFAAMTGNASDVILGKGFLNCEEVFAAMKDVGFPNDGALSLEYEANPTNPDADIAECVKVAKAALGKV